MALLCPSLAVLFELAPIVRWCWITEMQQRRSQARWRTRLQQDTLMNQIIAEARPVAFEQPQYMVGGPAAMAYPTAAKLCQSGDFIGVGNTVEQHALDLLREFGRHPLIGVK